MVAATLGANILELHGHSAVGAAKAATFLLPTASSSPEWRSIALPSRSWIASFGLIASLNERSRKTPGANPTSSQVIFESLAEVAQALGRPKRVVLLEYLAQGKR